MKILFWGGGKGNNGPNNVSNSYRMHLTESFVLVKSHHKYGELIEAVWKLLFSDCVVVSGVSRKGVLLVGIARIFGKKSLFIMHGCAEYECEINKVKCSRQALAQERYLLKHCTLLLPVSRKFMFWVRERYPRYAYKTQYLHNGIEKDLLPKGMVISKRPNTVIAAGGNRIQKANDVISEAVESMEGKTTLKIYGGLSRPYPQDVYRYVKYMGRIPHDQFVEKMAESELLVLNSLFEPFSLAIVEALVCGCSVLVSEAAGVTDLLALEETDIIHDPMDQNEIRWKIEYLLAHPNNERILASLNVEEYSYPRQVQKLERICRELVEKRCGDREQ